MVPGFLLFIRQIVSDTLQPHGLQHTRLLCPSLSSGVCSNSCPLSCWCYLTISSSDAPFFCLQYFPSFPKSQLFTSSGKHWSFGISPSIECSGLISFRIGWFYLAVQGALEFRLSNLMLLLRQAKWSKEPNICSQPGVKFDFYERILWVWEGWNLWGVRPKRQTRMDYEGS